MRNTESHGTTRKIEIVDAKHQHLFGDFRCNPERCLNPEHFVDYLLYNAMSDKVSGLGMTHVLCEYRGTVPVRILGFVTLKAACLITDVENHRKIAGEPAIEISELAVDKRYEGQGIGKDLLFYAVNTSMFLHDRHIGTKYIIVYAGEKAAAFYEHVMPFRKVSSYHVIPHEQWNADCVPMYLKLDNIKRNRK